MSLQNKGRPIARGQVIFYLIQIFIKSVSTPRRRRKTQRPINSIPHPWGRSRLIVWIPSHYFTPWERSLSRKSIASPSPSRSATITPPSILGDSPEIAHFLRELDIIITHALELIRQNKPGRRTLPCTGRLNRFLFSFPSSPSILCWMFWDLGDSVLPFDSAR